MLKRKFKSSLLTLMLFVTISSIVLPIMGDFSSSFMIYLIYMSIGILFGASLSLIIEIYVKKFWLRFVFHLLILIPVAIIPPFLIFALPIAITFFLIDESIKKYNKRQSQKKMYKCKNA
ncbi:hypothetical protein [Halobacillus sp. A5]|uniref:hypothetical protein n=1 Tax=Halobacillus sp. A5 TaxID=2880263 RepID=UPI0020A64CCF|nr:hypothetical protein [Halobacillus sp. A5]MCP3028727.1 hypothetical protein [Halobacillus sp. A5]